MYNTIEKAENKQQGWENWSRLETPRWKPIQALRFCFCRTCDSFRKTQFLAHVFAEAQCCQHLLEVVIPTSYANGHDIRLTLETLPLLWLHFPPLRPRMPPPQSCLPGPHCSAPRPELHYRRALRANSTIIWHAFVDRTPMKIVFTNMSLARTLGAFTAIREGINKFMPL